jgi:hypothetical protein
MGAEPHYRFEYGTTSCAATPSPCASVPAVPGSYLGAGFGDQPASVDLTSLSPGTTYYVRVVASNEFAEGEHAVISEERTFVTAPSTSAPELPDGRAWELVSPAERHGAGIEPIQVFGGVIQAALDGRSITYMATAPLGESEPVGNRAPERSQVLSRRTSPGTWTAQDIAPPDESAAGIHLGQPRDYRLFTPELEEALLQPIGTPPLSPLVSEETVYLRNLELGCGDSQAGGACYEPLVDPSDDTAKSSFGSNLSALAGTKDLQHVIIESKVPLTAGESGEGLYEWSKGEHGGTLAPVSILPDKVLVPGGLGASERSTMRATAISEDGSRVIWSDVTNPATAGHLYMREVEKEQTLQVDEPNSGAPVAKLAAAAVFDTASSDGSKVFFTDPRRLTAESTAPETESLSVASGSPSDLYVFEANKPEGERLVDLTVNPNPSSGEGAGVQGSALASEDGSTVYFVANGVLAEGAKPGNCHPYAPSTNACNLYVVHYNGEEWGKPVFIARLSAGDNPSWGSPAPGERYDLEKMTSRVSPNGEYLAFMSSMPLPTAGRPAGYDNTDANNSSARDEEVYLYHYGPGAVTDNLVCASCDPSGAQPVGVHDIRESGEGDGLVVDRPAIWSKSTKKKEVFDPCLAGSVPGWTALGEDVADYQSNYLTNAGRLFFNSPDALVANDRNEGEEDVYEYEPTGVGSCEADNTELGCVALISGGEAEHESAFLDASESGNDVFFVTSAKLSPVEVEAGYSLYDARVCQGSGAEEPCPTTSSVEETHCSDEATCKAPATPPPLYGAPASSTSSGSGNIAAAQSGVLASKTTAKAKPLTRAQKLAAALKSCRKLKHKKQRAACEKQAQKRYGAKKESAKKSSVGRTDHSQGDGR